MVRKMQLDDAQTNTLRNRSENWVVSAIKLARLRKREEDRRKYKWTGKISPSGLKNGLVSCPKKVILDSQKQMAADSDGMERMELGKALHYLFQTESLDVDQLLWEKPEIHESYNETEKAKFLKHWPEVPVIDPVARISGRADLVINLFGKPVVIDLKFPQDKDGNDDFTSDPAKWEEKKATYVMTKDNPHTAQVCLYIHVMNKFNYYSVPIERGGLVYYNPFVSEKKGVPECERYFEYEPFREMTESLVEHLTMHVEATLKEQDLPCTYPFCETHTGTPKTRKKST